MSASPLPHQDGHAAIALARDLCEPAAGVVAAGNDALFARLARELPFTLHRWQSGDTHIGWEVPQDWSVKRAEIRKDGKLLYDATCHTLAVARYSKSFTGRLSFEALRPHLVTHHSLPDAITFHCQWQYRPWAADWAICLPQNVMKDWGPGDYDVVLETEYKPGHMIVGTADLPGETDCTIIFHSNSCHPHMANDGFAGTAVLIQLMQRLAKRRRRYGYRLVVGPEHIGTVFYLRDLPRAEREKIVCGIFEEMPGTKGPVKICSTFLGGHKLDLALRNAARHFSKAHDMVPWRQGAGNDETVWEAPGIEVPFAEVTRSEELLQPFREYHTNFDTPDLMDAGQLQEMLDVLDRAVMALEEDARIYRRFDGLVALSNPAYDLYFERKDPAVPLDLPEDQEKWGYLLDCALRYMDGSMTILEIAERHDLPFARVRAWLQQFADKGLVDLVFDPVIRKPAQSWREIKRP